MEYDLRFFCICHAFDLVLNSVWDLRSNEEVKSIPASNAVTSLELSRDKTLLAACHDRIVTVYDVDT